MCIAWEAAVSLPCSVSSLQPKIQDRMTVTDPRHGWASDCSCFHTVTVPIEHGLNLHAPDSVQQWFFFCLGIFLAYRFLPCSETSSGRKRTRQQPEAGAGRKNEPSIYAASQPYHPGAEGALPPGNEFASSSRCTFSRGRLWYNLIVAKFTPEPPPRHASAKRHWWMVAWMGKCVRVVRWKTCNWLYSKDMTCAIPATVLTLVPLKLYRRVVAPTHLLLGI